jgi:hypothetical protein
MGTDEGDSNDPATTGPKGPRGNGPTTCVLSLATRSSAQRLSRSNYRPRSGARALDDPNGSTWRYGAPEPPGKRCDWWNSHTFSRRLSPSVDPHRQQRPWSLQLVIFPVQKVLNVDLLDVAVIGDPIVPAFAPDPSGQSRIRPIGIAGNPDTGQLETATDRKRSNDPVVCSTSARSVRRHVQLLRGQPRRLRGRSRPRRPDDRRGLGRQPPPLPREPLGPPAAAPAGNRRTPAVKLANISARAALVLGARSPTSPSCPAGSAPSS